jgi:hypothetical protein
MKVIVTINSRMIGKPSFIGFMEGLLVDPLETGGDCRIADYIGAEPGPAFREVGRGRKSRLGSLTSKASPQANWLDDCASQIRDPRDRNRPPVSFFSSGRSQ